MHKPWILAGCVGGLVLLVPLGASAGDDRQQVETSKGHTTDLVFHDNWPSFRGPNSLGLVTRANPPLKWSAEDGTGIAWKIALPKPGMSSPIAWANRVFLTGADEQTRQLYCIDADTGQLIWQHDVSGVPGSPDEGGLPHVLEQTGFAAPTPTTNGKYVAAVFATGELVCVTLEGKRNWIRHLGIPRNHYGHASSLLCYGNLLFVQYDQKDDAQLLTFDLASGKRLWEAKRGAMSWSSPILAENRGKMELILTNSRAVEGYDPRSGQSLWRVDCLDGEVASSAAYAHGTIFVANEGAPARAIAIHHPEPRTLWQWDEALPDAASPVANDKYLIMPTAFGVVTCLDVKTSKVLWEHEFGDGFYSSPISVNDRIYIVDLSGTTHIFKMDGEFELLGTGEVGEPVYATPAFLGDRIFLRSLWHVYCLQAKTRWTSSTITAVHDER